MGDLLSALAQSNILNSTVSSPQMSVLNPQTGLAVDSVIPKNQMTTDDPVKSVQRLKNTSEGNIGGASGTTSGSEPRYSAESVAFYSEGVSDLLKAGVSIGNGYLSKMSAEAKETGYRFQAAQNRRSAKLLLDNQIEVTRAAQKDSNQYRIAGEETRAKQVSAMSGSGFAVGKGVYKNALNTTAARVNYNVSNLMLKAALDNSNLTRQAGQLNAQAIINEANADIAHAEGKMSVLNGWINGIGNFISANASFYCGYVKNGGTNPFSGISSKIENLFSSSNK